MQVGGKEQIARNVVNSPGVSMVHVGRHGNVTVTSDGVEFPVVLVSFSIHCLFNLNFSQFSVLLDQGTSHPY